MLERRMISAEKLDSFVSKSPFVHYMKTSAWGEFKNRTEGSFCSFMGFYDGEELKATAMILTDSFLTHRFHYIPKGPCLDYTDKALRREVFELLKEYAVDDKTQFLRIDPDVIRISRDILGNPVEGINNEDLTEQLIELGFAHRGYNYAYDGSSSNRYTLIVDLDRPMEEVIKGFSKQRRTSLNRHAVSGVATRIGNASDIPSLMAFEKMLSEQDGFRPHSKSFFENLLQCFEGHARLYVTEISIDAMAAGIEAELQSKKYRKDPEARQAKENDLQRAMKLKSEYGSSLPIACGLFVNYGDMSWDLYTYNHKEFNFIKPVDNLHAFAMKDMQERGVKRYDMCGFSGVTSKDDPEYGLYSYKRSFGPEFIEQIGEFDFVINPAAYQRFKTEKSLEIRARHKIWNMLYQKKPR